MLPNEGRLAVARCEGCGAPLGVRGGAICAGCRRLLCHRHFPALSWGGVLSRSGSRLLCRACQGMPRGTTEERGGRGDV